jgi:pyrroline-5-carboxylate reductase
MASAAASATSSSMFEKITFIGAGKMAQAMIDPLITNGYQPMEKISVFDVSTKVVEELKSRFPDIQTSESIGEAVHESECIVLAVKPQNVNESFWKEFPKPKKVDEDSDSSFSLREDATLLSILAGTPVKDFAPSGISKVVRGMPNTPSTIGEGMTVWCCTSNLTSCDRKSISKLLNTFGKAIYVDDEKFVDMSTSISGSGPAYIFMLMEAMIDAGVHMGFSRDTATTLVHHTLLGSTLYAMETDEHPAILRNSVTSPAGTTASAIYELEKGGLRPLVNDAIWACYRRSLEMGGHNSAVGPGMVYQVGEKPSTSTKHEIHYMDSDSHTENVPSGEIITRKEDEKY